LIHLDAMTALCRDLVPLGCRIGIEHFGREFGQIARLHHIGLSYLKLDASYTREVASSEGNRAFLAGLRSIASAIGVKLYAEGVTTPEEIATLAAIGFDGVTGPGVRQP
jgi:EAL domain-containing protein (putative c-di-GMP-specific phosphodiesterase class I)